MDLPKYDELNLREFETHSIIYKLINSNSRLLDVGSATGYFAKALKNKNCRVWGIELNSRSAQVSKTHLEKVYIGDISKVESFKLKRNFFDYILLMDVIEHLINIEDVLKKIKKYMKEGGEVIISTPNIAHISIRVNLFLGKFDYTPMGIMDETHIHFYTKKNLIILLKSMNFRINKIDYSADFGQIPILGRFLRHIPKFIQYEITKIFPTLLAVQFIIECK